MTRSPSRRTVLALATGSLLVGGLAGPALALASVGTDDKEYVCLYTRNDPQTGEKDGFCVGFPAVLPPTPAAAG